MADSTEDTKAPGESVTSAANKAAQRLQQVQGAQDGNPQIQPNVPDRRRKDINISKLRETKSDDDLSTAKKKAKQEGYVIFRSRKPEPARFDIKVGFQHIRGGYAPDPEYLEWHVPKKMVDAIRNHHLAKTQRIVEV